jgi:hypothetical protein
VFERDRRELDRRYARTAVRVAEVRQLPAGAGLAAALIALRAEPADAPTSVEIHALWGTVISWAQAEQMIATHDALHGAGYLASLDGAEQIQVVAQEAAAATHRSYATAMNDVSPALVVGQDLDAAWMALGDLPVPWLRPSGHHLRDRPRRRVEPRRADRCAQPACALPAAPHVHDEAALAGRGQHRWQRNLAQPLRLHLHQASR